MCLSAITTKSVTHQLNVLSCTNWHSSICPKPERSVLIPSFGSNKRLEALNVSFEKSKYFSRTVYPDSDKVPTAFSSGIKFLAETCSGIHAGSKNLGSE